MTTSSKRARTSTGVDQAINPYASLKPGVRTAILFSNERSPNGQTWSCIADEFEAWLCGDDFSLPEYVPHSWDYPKLPLLQEDIDALTELYRMLRAIPPDIDLNTEPEVNPVTKLQDRVEQFASDYYALRADESTECSWCETDCLGDTITTLELKHVTLDLCPSCFQDLRDVVNGQ